MQTRIIGSVLPVLEVDLEAGETLIGMPEQLSWMSGGITLHTSAGGGASGGGIAATSPSCCRSSLRVSPRSVDIPIGDPSLAVDDEGSTAPTATQ